MEQPVAHVTHGLNTAMETRRRPGRLSSSPASLRGTLRGEPRLWQLAGPGPRGGSLPSGVLRARRPGAWRELDLPTRRVIAAPVTTEVWADVASAAGVEGESGWAAGGWVVAVAPFHEHDQRRREFASFVGEDVLGSAGSFWVWDAFEHFFVAEAFESVGEDV